MVDMDIMAITHVHITTAPAVEFVRNVLAVMGGKQSAGISAADITGVKNSVTIVTPRAASENRSCLLALLV